MPGDSPRRLEAAIAERLIFLYHGGRNSSKSRPGIFRRDLANYTDARDYMVGAGRYDDVAGLIRLLRHKAKTQMPCKDYIAHYRENYEEVPLWAPVKDLASKSHRRTHPCPWL